MRKKVKFIYVYIILLALGTTTLFQPSIRVKATKDSRFGITARNDYRGIVRRDGVNDWSILEDRLRLMSRLGVTHDRLFVETSTLFGEDGTISYGYLDYLDHVLDYYDEYGIESYILLNNDSELVGASEKCDEVHPNWPIDLWHSRPQNWIMWDAYVHELVSRYGSQGSNQVQYWEISPEWNYPGCQFQKYPESYKTFLKDTRQIILNADSSAKIVLGRLLPKDNADSLDTLLSTDAGGLIDVISIGGPYQCDSAQNAGVFVEDITQVLNNHGLTKETWLTEVACASDFDEDGTSDPEGLTVRNTYITDVVNSAFSSGVDRFYFWTLFDRPTFPLVNRRATGLATIIDDHHFDLKPSFFTYSQLANPSSPTPYPTPTIPGDINGDSVVNIDDYYLILDNMSLENCQANSTTETCQVDIYDFTLVVANLNR